MIPPPRLSTPPPLTLRIPLPTPAKLAVNDPPPTLTAPVFVPPTEREPPMVLVPVRVNVPAPVLRRLPPPDMAPEYKVLLLSLPVVSVAEPSSTLPAPASEPMVWFKLLRSRLAPAPTVKALLAENALVLPARNVPPETSVLPD